MFLPFETDKASTLVQGFSNFLTKEECEIIVDFCTKKINYTAAIGNDVINKEIRKNKVTWINQRDVSLGWLIKKIAGALKDINDKTYQFDLYGLTEEIQFTEYSEIEDHYDWHFDSGPMTQVRKVSMVIQLSDPKDYEGCELEIVNQKKEITEKSKDQGTLIVFPSYIAHRVTGLKSGKRYSLVVWAGGPNFK
jgi:PKHD-type hydroxylase